MTFDPEEVEKLSSGARVEVQDFYARKFLAEVEPRQPERRRHMQLKFRKRDWFKPWQANLDPVSAQQRRIEHSGKLVQEAAKKQAWRVATGRR